MKYPQKVNDGIIQNGEIRSTVQPCEVCGQDSLCVIPMRIVMPVGIKVESTILSRHTNPIKVINYLGITCGCYAKFHRQVAHIEDKMKGRKP